MNALDSNESLRDPNFIIVNLIFEIFTFSIAIKENLQVKTNLCNAGQLHTHVFWSSLSKGT